MEKKLLIFSILAVFVIASGGCARLKKRDLEIHGLRNQISVLEAQIQIKDEEINALKESLSKTKELEEKETQEASAKILGRKKIIGEVKSRPNTRQIQVALTNAGFGPGVIDGKMGKRTRNAIKRFQSANNLPADGKVGHNTWSLLKEYLYKRVK